MVMMFALSITSGVYLLMFSPFERMVAFRYLRAKRKEGFISVIAGFSLLGVALGVAALIVVMSVMNGFHKELMGKILGFNGHVQIYGIERGIGDFDTTAATIRNVAGVVSVTPLIEGQVMATNQGVAGGALVKGIRREDIYQKPLIADNIISGTLDDFSGDDSIVLGSELARSLRVNPGDNLTLISPIGTATAVGMVPRMKAYRVAAIFEAGMYQYDSSIIFMPLEAAQLYFRLPKQVSTLEVMTNNPDHARTVASLIYQRLEGKNRVIDWQLSNSHFFNALAVERSVMFLILALIIVVAAFNIVSSLIMLVKDKGKDIAILRTMGASRGMVLRIFFLCGSSIGVAGTFLGFVLGVSFALNIETIRKWLESLTGSRLFDPVIYYLSQLPADVESLDVAKVVLMALVLSFLATIYPAWKAARLDPVEGLRYE